MWNIILVYFYTIAVVVSVLVDPLPRPQSINWFGNTSITIDINQLQLNTNSSILNDAFSRTIAQVRRAKWSPYDYTNLTDPIVVVSSTLESHVIDIQVDDLDQDLQVGVDESFELQVNETQIGISSGTIWGALHALTTLAQLLVYKGNNGHWICESSVHIEDYPQYQHRGLMIDSARNFLPVANVLEQIEIMSLCKMNVLHWHLVDSQSWPLLLESHPEMIRDAYSQGEIYTKDELKLVQDFARSRGVRVIPEIDMPGHARAGWRQIDPNIVLCGNDWWGDVAVEPPPGQLNIMDLDTYKYISDVYNELSNVFGDNYFHVGNDELQKNCFPSEWFNNATTLGDVVQHYIDRALPLFNAIPGRKLMMWDDVLLSSDGAAHSLPSNVTLQVWHEQSGVKNLTLQGYEVVVSLSSHLYLDCGYGGWVTDDFRYVDSAENEEFNNGQGGSWCAPYKTWQRIYTFDIAQNLTREESKLVLGAEAVLFSEQVDFTVLTGKIWPRTSALAESLWSGNKNAEGVFRLEEMTTRILLFREFLVKAGHPAAPLVPKYCVMNPHACDLNKPK